MAEPIRSSDVTARVAQRVMHPVRIGLTVSFEMPPGTLADDARDYVGRALRNYGGLMRSEDDLFFQLLRGLRVDFTPESL